MKRITIQGFPRIGRNRELKKALEGFWAGDVDRESLEQCARAGRLYNYDVYRRSGLDFCPVGDFSFYDKMLDMALMFGVVPRRFRDLPESERYFAMARGRETADGGIEPLSMKKWFNTNYHYLIPEIEDLDFALDSGALLSLVREAREEGVNNPVPVIIGPLTFVALSRTVGDFSPREILEALLPCYVRLLEELGGAVHVQVDEPVLVQSPLPMERELAEMAYAALAGAGTPIVLQTYFDEPGPDWSWIKDLPVQGFGLDFIHGPGSLERIEEYGFAADKLLVAGVVDGRNVWSLDVDRALSIARELESHVSEERLVLASSCSLLHVPYTMAGEEDLPLSFAEEKCAELAVLKGGDAATLDALRQRRSDFLEDPSRRDSAVRRDVEDLVASPRGRLNPFGDRALAQRSLNLPPLPTTTIGSFPQTAELRRQRRLWRTGDVSAEHYEEFIRQSIRDVIRIQEEIGLDVLVHGEFERNDMVEYFGERLDGFLFTRNGWVQSYGSRCVKPPVIYGDVSRPEPMTVETTAFAQSLTDRPVKGMLTGPVTILNWSFVRDDQPRSATCRQIAAAMRREVLDLEAAGIRVIQVDEAAFREGLPLRDEQKTAYLDWAVECFHLSVDGVRDATQIHTHMCYSEFNEIMAHIIAMDADVITIENSRGGLKLLEAFLENSYPSQIGPGVYDIHSPLVPATDDILARFEKILDVLDPAQLWINPDCGLKTRHWEETVPSLENMVSAAVILRERLGNADA